MIHYRLDLLVIFLISGLGLWLWSRMKSQRRNPEGLPLPPGPKGLPIIGNVLDMPNDKEWLIFADWAKKYGDIISVENMGNRLIFLNSYQAAFDLLDRRSSIYSDRPRFPMMVDIMGWDWGLPLMPYGPEFRTIRQLLNRFLQPTAARDCQDLQTRETYILLANLIESPNDFVHHLRRTAAAVIMKMAYGHEVAPEGDVFVTIADKAMEGFARGIRPGVWLVDVFPWLRHVPAWFPGAGWKRQGLEWYKASQSMLMTPFIMTKEKIRNGTATPSMISQLLGDNIDKNGEVANENHIAGTAAIAYAGGADTTVSSLLSVILAMVLYPEVQKRAHEEIDRVIGKNRLPTFEDRESLPYIESIVREALRWNPVTPLATPHRVMVDDIYNGYFIPAGSSVVVNQWSILHDKQEYPDPMSFRPERWLPKKGQEGPRHPNKAAFGWGRRLCPGRYFADQSIFIGTVCLLAMFKIDKALDANGQPITPSTEYTAGVISHPVPFECSIKPRSPEAIALLRQTIENTE